MIIQILKHTPPWVLVLFFVLLYLGYLQSKTRSVPKWRLAALPLVFLFLALSGVISASGASPTGVAAWAVAVVAALLLNQVLRYPRGVVYQPDTKLFIVPGSWVSLVLMMAIFFTKYAAAVAGALIRNPSFRQTAIFNAVPALIYGFLSGMFLARTLCIWRYGDSEGRTDAFSRH